MKKVLIWDLFPRLNIGGPLGYLYNVRQYLLEHPAEQITFFTDLVLEKQGEAEWLQPTSLFLGEPKTRLGQLWRRIAGIYYTSIMPFRGLEFQVPQDINIDEYDFVHIHQVTHFQQFKQIFPDYKGKVIITSHSPCPFSDELVERSVSEKAKLYKWYKRIKPSIHRYLIRKECEAYDMTDLVMFPCAGAREPYEKNEAMRKAFARNNDKFFYVPTAIVDYQPDKKTAQKLSDFGIPDDAFVITYFGRHNTIKGYDILKKVGLSLLEKNPKLFILCAGNGSIEPPQHPRWIELGFINNVDDLLPQGDLYILPNRETYFDLITLQILRACVPVILSETGGNSYFKELPKSETRGMMLFDINDEQHLEAIVQQCIELKEKDPKKYQEMRVLNRQLFEKYFTLDKYISTYLENINTL